MENFIDQPTAIRAGEELDVAKLQAFLLAQIPAATGTLNIAQFPSGFSNLTYLISLGDKNYVLRRPPFGSTVKSAHDMGREYRILSGLAPVYGKVPQPILYTEDTSIIGAPFYLMERVEGIILRAKLPEAMQPSPEKMKAISQALVDNLVDLHQVDYQGAGLADFGRPEGYVARQVAGWTKRYFKAKTDEVPTVERAAQWLAEHLPPEQGATLIHNDYKYDNLVLDPNDWTQIIALLDWEMSTIGDPLMDLGTSLGYWVNRDDPPWMQGLALSPTTLPGNCSRAELVEWYAQKSGRDVGDMVFYYVYGLFKLIVIVQQIYYRYRHGHTQDARFAHLDKVVQGLGAMSLRVIEKKRLDGLF